MTSAEIRQSFLDFFKSKGHTIVPSASLLPDSPNLLFTNAGMNQFVPIFLGQRAADISKRPGAVPGSDKRAADTQKCIRAGGKHNDLEDVGLDTYHHTFFEMLGNWSFGDYFKKEAIDWAWELFTEVLKFPRERLYATVYSPDKSMGDPSEFDQEAYDFWAERFRSNGLDPKIHIVYGNKKDNFWMMGETGPCGPCSEIHVDLTPAGNSKGALVNTGDPRCIEIWNLVFIQFNANPDGSFSPLPAKHVDTGMGFERLTSFIQCTRNFTDFTRTISNYETDVFRPIFDRIERLSGKRYGSTLPGAGAVGQNETEKADIAFRVIADHLRTLGFAIADGIMPSNEGRGYVLRRILRRAVRYGRSLGFHDPFFYKLVGVLADTMGDVFPEIRAKQEHVEEVIQREEEAFNETLDKGTEIFEANLAYGNAARAMSPHAFALASVLSEGLASTPPKELVLLKVQESANAAAVIALELDTYATAGLPRACRVLRTAPANIEGGLTSLDSSPAMASESRQQIVDMLENEIPSLQSAIDLLESRASRIEGELAFELYDTYGFPLDLTQLMARERGLTVDVAGFDRLMEEQKARGRIKQKKTTVTLQEGVDLVSSTNFVGYDQTTISSRVLTTIEQGEGWGIVLPESPFYAEMGGQVGDTGTISAGARLWPVIDTKKVYLTWLHIVTGSEPPSIGTEVQAEVNVSRRSAIQRHHTVTHLLHWALHEVVSKDAVQKGSYVGPEKLTVDFSRRPLTPAR